MPVSSTSEYAEFFLSSASNVVMIETMIFDHSTFSPIYVVRNVQAGIDIDGNTYEYYPLQISNATTSDDMDYSMQVTFGDLGTLLPSLIDLIAVAGKFHEKPTAIYNVYRSDTMDLIFGNVVMEVTGITSDSNGSVLECAAPQITKNKVGEYYTIERFPMLAGFT